MLIIAVEILQAKNAATAYELYEGAKTAAGMDQLQSVVRMLLVRSQSSLNYFQTSAELHHTFFSALS